MSGCKREEEGEGGGGVCVFHNALLKAELDPALLARTGAVSHELLLVGRLGEQLEATQSLIVLRA